MGPAGTVDAFDLRRCGLSPFSTTAHCHARRLAITAFLTAVVVVVTVRDPGLLPPTAGVSTTVAGVDGPTSLVRLELGALAGALATGVSLTALADRDPAADLRAALGWPALTAVSFLVGIVTMRQFAPDFVDVLVERGHIATDSQQSTLELELFSPVAVGDGAAVAPLLLGLHHAGAFPRRLTGRIRRLPFPCLVTFAVCFSSPDSTTSTLYAALSAVGLGVTIARVEFR